MRKVSSKVTKFLLATISMISFSGCQSTYRAIERYEEDRDRRKLDRVMQERAAIQQECISFGFKPNTPQMANCIMRMTMAKRQQDAIDEADAWRMTQDLLKPWGPPPK